MSRSASPFHAFFYSSQKYISLLHLLREKNENKRISIEKELALRFLNQFKETRGDTNKNDISTSMVKSIKLNTITGQGFYSLHFHVYLNENKLINLNSRTFGKQTVHDVNHIKGVGKTHANDLINNLVFHPYWWMVFHNKGHP